jgi:hypothetical protein
MLFRKVREPEMFDPIYIKQQAEFVEKRTKEGAGGD